MFTLLLLCLFLLSFPSLAQMGGFPQFEWGARYLGSLLFSSPLDDAFGVFYNPAFLSFLESSQIGSEQRIVFGVPFTAITFAYAPIPLGGHLVIQETPEGLGFHYNTYRLTLGTALYRGGVSLGLAPKIYYQAITGINGDITSLGYGADAGITVKQEFSLGDLYLSLAGEDAYSVTETAGGVEERVASPKFRAGGGFFREGLVVGATVIQKDKQLEYCLGAEYDLLSPWAGKTEGIIKEICIRGGIWETEEDRIYALGIGVYLRGFRIDYAYLFTTYKTETMLSTSLSF